MGKRSFENFGTLTYCNTPTVLCYAIFEWIQNKEQKISAFWLFFFTQPVVWCSHFEFEPISYFSVININFEPVFRLLENVLLVAQLFLFIRIQLHQRFWLKAIVGTTATSQDYCFRHIFCSGGNSFLKMCLV